MAEYTSTREGFQKAMQWSLTGPADNAKEYVDETSMATFYQIINGKRLQYEDYLEGLSDWRNKISEYLPVVEEFLRDGDQLAARMTGTIKVEGEALAFESFMFARVNERSGKMEWLIERSVWGPVNEEPSHGIN